MARHMSDLKYRELRLRDHIESAVEAWPQFDDPDERVSGADLVEWFDYWRRTAIRLLAETARMS